MLLAIDVGNTQTVVGLFNGADLADHWRIATDANRTSDELALMIQQFLGFHGFSFDDAITGVSVSSVVPRVTAELRQLTERYFSMPALVVEPGVRTGMPILYEPPGDVGADRIVNGVAAFAAYGGPVIVVDFGTATTFDVVTKKGEYLGGVICPGIGISADALFQRAARLPRVDIRNPGKVIGRSTVGSMQSGLYFGYASMVEGLIARIRTELGEPARAVATGGLAESMASDLPSIEAVDPVLTLTGLRLIWERNRASGGR
jgi:type III pantothenate kinase